MENIVNDYDQKFFFMFEKLNDAIEEQESEYPDSTTVKIDEASESIHELVNICNEISSVENSEFIVFT